MEESQLNLLKLLVEFVIDNDLVNISGDPIDDKDDRDAFMDRVLDNELAMDEPVIRQFLEVYQEKLGLSFSESIYDSLFVETEPGDLDVATFLRIVDLSSY